MSAQGDDTTLGDFQASDWTYTPLALVRARPDVALVERELDAWGMEAGWLGDPGERTPFDEFRRFQYDRLYFFPRRTGGDKVEYEPVEFRTYINFVGVVPDALEDHIREAVNPHLRTLFDSGPYQGWMSGYQFQYHTSNVESSEATRIAEDEALHLGVPQWEVLVKKSGKTQGLASGFADPFTLVEHAPEHAVWQVTRNDAREAYELRPRPGRGRQRLAGQRKEAYLNGHFVGNTVPSRPGAVWLKMDYGTADGTYKDSHTGQQMWSRQKLIDDSQTLPVTPGMIRAGGTVYKTNETPQRITLVAARRQTPDEFDPTPGEAIPPEMAEAPAELTLAECTNFDIRQDQGPQLGKYTPPETREICEGTEFTTEPMGAR